MTQILLRGDGLRKVYRRGHSEVQALDGVDIAVQPGEMVAIMGPSGCGKSTLLHLLTGIDTPTAGRVILDDIDLTAQTAEERASLRRTRMGLLFQAHGLMPGLTVGENVALPLALSGVGAAERAARAVALLSMVGLENRQENLPDDLSGGQRQRVALARALANNPSIVMADEPTGSLDSVTARSVLDALFGLLRAHGTALVMVTHDAEASWRADRVVHLRDGRIEAHSSSAQQTLSEPRGEEVSL